MERRAPRPATFWSVLVAVLVSDVVTKAAAVTYLVPRRMPREVIGEAVQFTLVYNPGAAFGWSVGPASRWIFMGLTILALVILWRLYEDTREEQRVRLLALALVCGGALGNLVDRIRWPRGVVDFIDIGWGGSRWPTFNLADVAVFVGAVMLAWVLWEEDQASASVSGHSPASVPSES
jgi:signal peptidase II